jgi:hypothetical protein
LEDKSQKVAPSEDRTHDFRIMRPALYQLSYRSCQLLGDDSGNLVFLNLGLGNGPSKWIDAPAKSANNLGGKSLRWMTSSTESMVWVPEIPCQKYFPMLLALELDDDPVGTRLLMASIMHLHARIYGSIKILARHPTRAIESIRFIISGDSCS